MRVLTAILLVALGSTPTPARAGMILLSVGAYQSPNFENDQGTASFHSDGTTNAPDPVETITINDGQTVIVGLDYSFGVQFNSPPSNGDPTTVFSGVSTSSITVDGVTGTVTDPYTFQVPPPQSLPPNNPAFSGGTTIVLDLGNEQVRITTLASLAFREASITLTSTVPEPPSAFLVAIAGLIGLACARIRRPDRRGATR